MPEKMKPVLMAKAVQLKHRADVLASRAIGSPTREEILLVALAAADAQTWLIEADAANDKNELISVDASLNAQAVRLDTLENMIGVSRKAPPS